MNIAQSVSHVLAALFNDRSRFKRRWNDPAAAGQRWQGEWVSQSNGHQGELKCLLTPRDGNNFEADFFAVYGGFFKVAYHVSLQGRAADGKIVLEGEADLGKLAGGVYHYAGTLDDAALDCTYKCAYDHGTFHLRPLRR